MAKIYREVVSEEEAYECCEELGYNLIRVDRSLDGNLTMVAEDNSNIKTADDSEYDYKDDTDDAKYVVFAYFAGTNSKMYVHNKGSEHVTFSKSEADVFSKKAAADKAFYMRSHENYDWQIEKV